MFKRLIPVIVLIVVPACDQSSGNNVGRDGSTPAGGKADAVGGSGGAISCPADVYVTHAANDKNDHVFSNCHNAANGKFVNKTCCAEAMDFIEEISGCPSQVRFSDADDASDTRCMNDTAGHPGKGQFVQTACCAPLCDSTAQFDDYGYCRDAGGQFDEAICCHRNFGLTQANCGGAQWEAVDGGSRDFVCRASNGQFTFDSCCLDACAAEISMTAQVPEACNLDSLVADECPGGSTPNSGGLCHNPVNGQFVKAVCCELSGETEGLEIAQSDACYAGISDDPLCVTG